MMEVRLRLVKDLEGWAGEWCCRKFQSGVRSRKFGLLLQLQNKLDIDLKEMFSYFAHSFGNEAPHEAFASFAWMV